MNVEKDIYGRSAQCRASRQSWIVPAIWRDLPRCAGEEIALSRVPSNTNNTTTIVKVLDQRRWWVGSIRGLDWAGLGFYDTVTGWEPGSNDCVRWRLRATCKTSFRLDSDTPLSSITTLIPRPPLASRPHSWLPSTNPPYFTLASLHFLSPLLFFSPSLFSPSPPHLPFPFSLFSVAPDCRWRRRLSRFFARRHIFSSTFSFSNL